MRTTINLPDALGEAVKKRAAAERRTFTSMVEEGLRAVLADRDQPAQEIALPSYGDADGEILVDLSDREAVWDALDADGMR